MGVARAECDSFKPPDMVSFGTFAKRKRRIERSPCKVTLAVGELRPGVESSLNPGPCLLLGELS